MKNDEQEHREGSPPDWWKHDKPYKIGDCIELMKGIPDKSVDLVLTDPPYYRIMLEDHRGTKYNWDNQWETFEEYLTWTASWLKQCYRVLKHNGSIYVFADDKRSAHIQIEMEKIGFFLENHIVWRKTSNMTNKGWKNNNCYSSTTERILFCSKEHRTQNLENVFYSETIKAFAPIIEYMISEKRKVKELKEFGTDKEFDEFVNKITGTRSVVSRHYFTYSQWCFPTRELYSKLQSINEEVFQKEYEVLKKEYEVLKKEYEVLKKEYEDLLRTFQPEKNFTDVWSFNTAASSEKTFHPTTKPVPIFERIIETSTQPTDTVLDPFLGSGTTLLACRKTNRIGLGFEINPDYEPVIKKRMMEDIPDLFTFGDSL